MQTQHEPHILIEIIDDSDTNENSDGNADDSVEPGNDIEHTFHRVNDSQKELRSMNQATEFETRPYRPRRVACHICGKLYEVYAMKFHMNRHNGKWLEV